MAKLTKRQSKFIAAYSGNATKAALSAGYSKKTAYSSGQRLLKHVEISKLIKSREQKQETKLIATREDRQKAWTSVMNDKDQSMSDRLRASELLGKSEGDFIDRVAHEGELKITQMPFIRKDGKEVKFNVGS